MELEKRKIVVFTPSRRVGGKRVVCYDDRFIVKLAYELDGVIVSNDTYRDLQGERPDWKKCIEERLLMYSFVNDKWAISLFFTVSLWDLAFCFLESHQYHLRGLQPDIELREI